jgi:hypothetical protein
MRGLGLRLRFCLHVLACTYVDMCVWLVSAGDSELVRLLDRTVNIERYFYLFSFWCMFDLSRRVVYRQIREVFIKEEESFMRLADEMKSRRRVIPPPPLRNGLKL